jgi:hypothetical protein
VSMRGIPRRREHPSIAPPLAENDWRDVAPRANARRPTRRRVRATSKNAVMSALRRTNGGVRAYSARATRAVLTYWAIRQVETHPDTPAVDARARR